MYALQCLYLTGLHIHLFKIQVCCYKANHTTDITLYKVTNYTCMYIIISSLHPKTFHIDVDLHEMYILCPVNELLLRKLN